MNSATDPAADSATNPVMKPELHAAVTAALDKKAADPVALELRCVCSFTDYFLICTGANARQVQAISEEIELRLKRGGLRPYHIEGYPQAEWILMDYVDFMVHVFSPKARLYYDLERLWRMAPRIRLEEAG